MRSLALVAKPSTALGLISSKTHIPHLAPHRRVRHIMSTSEQDVGTRASYIDAGANLLDSMYQGSYHGKTRHEPDLDLVLERSFVNGIRHIISLAGTSKESEDLLALISQLDQTDCNNQKKVQVFGTVGIHPTRCAEEFADRIPSDNETPTWIPKTEQQQNEVIENLISIAKTGKSSGSVVAVGEFGLDYARLQFCPKDIQQIGLRAQLEVAIETKLPLYLHNRESGDDLFSILTEYEDRLMFDKDYHGIRGIVHSFDESLDIAKKFISLGLFIGINGCSLKTADNLATVKGIPLESIILETGKLGIAHSTGLDIYLLTFQFDFHLPSDCPWCDIRPTHAGHSYVRTSFPSKKEKQYNVDKDFCVKNRTEPCHVLQVAEVIAGVKGINDYEVLEICCNNVFCLFGNLNKK